MNTEQTVLQKFWTRVFNQPSDTGMLIRTPHPQEPEVYPVVVPMYPSTIVVWPPKFLPLSWQNMGLAVSAISAFLRARGFSRGDRAAILGWNSPEWVLADLAIQSLGGITVPIYPHSSPEQVNYVLKDSGAKFLFSNEQAQLEKAADGTCETVLFDRVIELVTGVRAPSQVLFMHYFLLPGEMEKNPALQCATAAELRRFEAVAKGDPCCGVTRADDATIIYTSGSTGVPKGVVLTHGNFAAVCEGMVAHGIDINPESDVYLSYLPLAHVYERAAGMSLCLWTGVPQGFCRIEEVGQALKDLQPTLLHGVPAVWRKMKEKIDAGIAEAHGLKAKLINWAFKQEKGTFFGWFADLLVFSKIRGELGGRLRIATSGGAAISPDIVNFFRHIGIQLLEGYGLTETTGAAVVNRPGDCGRPACYKSGSTGQLIDGSGLQMRIVPVPGQEDEEDGEIQFHGPTVMSRYWNRPEDTRATFTEDGWFRTGDLGRVDKDGFLFITGRLKDLMKTDGGKYVPRAKIEKAMGDSAIVQYVVPVGDGKPFISGLIFINQLVAVEMLTKAGVAVPDSNRSTFIAHNELVVKAVEQAVASANTHLERWEQLKKIQIIEDEATIASGLLTPTLKIRAPEVLKRYASVIEELYRKPGKPNA